MTTLVETFEAAGFVGPVLLACAVFLWWGLGSRVFALRRPRAATLEDLLAGARAGRTLIELAISAGQREASRRRDLRRSHLDAVVEPYRQELARHATLVRSVVAIAPLAGLLGTVTGMIETFDSLGSMELFGRNGGIGAGISEAMISTQMGLVVAVPGLLVGSLLERRQSVLEDELDAALDRLGQGRSA